MRGVGVNASRVCGSTTPREHEHHNWDGVCAGSDVSPRNREGGCLPASSGILEFATDVLVTGPLSMDTLDGQDTSSGKCPYGGI